MFHYHNPTTGQIYAYDTEAERAEFGDPALVGPLTDAELATLRAPTPSQVASALKTAAKAALDASDVTMLRCMESGVALPSAWVSYRKSLRSIIDGSDTQSTSLPTRPPYPSGT